MLGLGEEAMLGEPLASVLAWPGLLPAEPLPERLVGRTSEALVALGEKDEARSLLIDLGQRLLATAARIGALELRANFLRNVPTHARVLELAGSADVPLYLSPSRSGC